MANIGIITTASADPTDSANFYQDLFVNTYGAASATWIAVTETSGNADTQEVKFVRGEGGREVLKVIFIWEGVKKKMRYI